MEAQAVPQPVKDAVNTVLERLDMYPKAERAVILTGFEALFNIETRVSAAA